MLVIPPGHCADCNLNFTASDYYQFADLLTPEEQAIRMKVRECMEKEIAPIMTKVFLLFSVFVECADIFLDSIIIAVANIVSRKQRYILNASILKSTEDMFTAVDALKSELLFNVFEQYWEKAEFPFEIIPKIGALHIAGGTIKVF